jgi:hypothetical protein
MHTERNTNPMNLGGGAAELRRKLVVAPELVSGFEVGKLEQSRRSCGIIDSPGGGLVVVNETLVCDCVFSKL